MSFLRAVATVSGLTLASRVFGFVRDVMAAAIMGAGPIADAFFVALRLPNFFRRMTAEGAFSVSFVPLFTRTLQQDGKEAATDFANQAMAIMLAVLVPFCVLAIIFMPYVLHVLAPGFDDHGGTRFDLAVTLTRITFFYLLFMSLSALVGGMLNALDRFAIFAVAPVLFNIMQIALLLVAFLFPTPGHALAWGVLISGISATGLDAMESAPPWLAFETDRACHDQQDPPPVAPDGSRHDRCQRGADQFAGRHHHRLDLADRRGFLPLLRRSPEPIAAGPDRHRCRHGAVAKAGAAHCG
jgi:hypothetical protein